MKKSFYYLITILCFFILITLIGYNELIIHKNSVEFEKLSEKNNSNNITTSNPTINCFGDVLTLGNQKTSYPTSLVDLTNFSVNKFGGSTDKSIDISIRLGKTKVYTQKVTIPATPSPVEIRLYNEKGEEIDALKGKSNYFSSVEIANIPGKLEYDIKKKIHTFTRSQNGNEGKITNLSQITSQYPTYNSDDIAIIFTGTFDDNVPMGIYKTITYQRAILNHLKTDKYIIISLTSKRKFSIVDDMNKVLLEEYGEHFLDFRSYIQKSGLKDANITPTKQDKQDLANHYIPSSLLNDDKLTGTNKFNSLLAKQIIDKLLDLGYISEELLKN